MNSHLDKSIACWVYSSSRKDEMYLYLAKKDAFDELPSGLLQQFGRPKLVLELELHPGRRLAREDVHQVISSLQERGFYLQLPPKMMPELYHLN
jgi:uncharacterized protein YcgL (UPF0745 family)